jgi:hypothetical protein
VVGHLIGAAMRQHAGCAVRRRTRMLTHGGSAEWL